MAAPLWLQMSILQAAGKCRRRCRRDVPHRTFSRCQWALSLLLVVVGWVHGSPSSVAGGGCAIDMSLDMAVVDGETSNTANAAAASKQDPPVIVKPRRIYVPIKENRRCERDDQPTGILSQVQSA